MNLYFYIITSHLFVLIYSKDWYKDRLTDAELEALENPDSVVPTASTKQKGPAIRNKNRDDSEVTVEQQQSTRKNLFNNARRRQQTRGQRRTTTTTTTLATPVEEIVEYEYEDVEE